MMNFACPLKIAMLIFVILALQVVSCATRIKLDPERAVSENDVLSVKATFLKHGRKDWVGKFFVENKSEEAVVIEFQDIHCFWGDVEGRIRYDRKFNIGERTIDFTRRQRKELAYRCFFDEKPSGDIRLVINQVYANPANDGGRTKGKMLVKDFEWRYELDQKN